jgi:hypothetical protein
MSQQQSQTVQVIQRNQGCFSGCGTVIAVLIVVGLAIAYWYVAVPLAIILAGTFLWYWYQQKQKLPAPGPGPLDSWLNRIAILLTDQGYVEQTRNTGQQLEGSPLRGDLVVEGHGMRLFVNAMHDADAATQTANRLRAKPDFQRGLGRQTVDVQTRGQLLLIARSQSGVLDQAQVSSALDAVAEIPPEGGRSLEAETVSAPDPAPATSRDDVFENIEKLAALRDSGVITAEEFEAKKAELLKRL